MDKAASTAFTMLSNADIQIMTYLKDMCEKPIEVVAGGVSLLILPFVMIWGYYRCIRIWCGLEQEPFLPFLRDVFFKIIIFSLVAVNAGAIGGDFKEYIKEPLLTIGQDLAVKTMQTVSEGDGTGRCALQNKLKNWIITGLQKIGWADRTVANGIFQSIDCKIGEIVAKFEDNQKIEMPLPKEQQDKLDDANAKLERCFVYENGRYKPKPDFMKDYFCSSRAVPDPVTGDDGIAAFQEDVEKQKFYASITPDVGLWIKIQFFIQKLIVLFSFIILGIAVFIVVMMNQVFLQMCLSVAPLFVFFAAFDRFRSWFNTWLNITLGYAFAYPFVVLVVGGLMAIFDSGNVSGTAGEESNYLLSWSNVFMIFVLCLIYAKFMAKIAALASQFFGGGNLAERLASSAISNAPRFTKSTVNVGLSPVIGTPNTRSPHRDPKTGKLVEGHYGGLVGLGIRGYRYIRKPKITSP